MPTEEWSQIKTNTPGTQFNEFNPTSQVELSISCVNLLNFDLVSKSDPQCIVYIKDTFRDGYTEIGRTEIIKDNLNPNFVKKIILSYNFEAIQRLKFDVWDIDITSNDFLGSCECTLAEIVANNASEFRRKLTGLPGKNCGEIVIIVEELSTCKQAVIVQFKATRLKRNTYFMKPDPFLLFWRANENGSYSVVHETEVCHSTQKPLWQKQKIRVRTLCNGDYDRSIRIDCMDHNRNGNHRLIGSCYTTLNKLVYDGLEKNIYTIKKKNKIKSCGTVDLVSIQMQDEPSFFDYIKGGLEMHFAVAIDFTLSNGETTDPRSLHYVNPNGQPNQYEIALRSIGEIIQPYNSRAMFPGFGFGAKVAPEYRVSHQFPLNGNAAHPYCNGVDDLMNSYLKCLTNIQLAGPTNFAPVIRSTAEIAKKYLNGSGYFVLLIITDGIISDIVQTKMEIINSSVLPLSLIIVGVGDADFSAMNELDADNQTLSVNGDKASRDIVQFVPLNRYMSRDGSFVQSKIDLAKEVLYEVPEQVVTYMLSKGIKPKAQ